MTEPTASRRRRLRVPAVLRDEPQYRLLFTGQVLSILGDRVTSIVLPFAVLSIGGRVGDESAHGSRTSDSYTALCAAQNSRVLSAASAA